MKEKSSDVLWGEVLLELFEWFEAHVRHGEATKVETAHSYSFNSFLCSKFF
jgi:hypothetical protein